MKKKITLGFSPCPNDTFIFDAMVHQRIDLHHFELEVVLADVEQLNRMALAGELDMTKLSYNAFARVHHSYQLLNAGSALGNNCGPLLISRQAMDEKQLNEASIAIPGKNTTANFLMSFAYPLAQNKQEFLFSEIEQAVLDGKVDAGVIIHENRFTYEQKGLTKIADLGMHWEQKTGFPIPLGGIAVHRELKPSDRHLLNSLMCESVQYAFDHPEASKDFVRCHSQEMEESVMKAHIALYVNDFTLDLGEKGKEAILKMYEIGQSLGMPRVEDSLFVK